MKELQEILIKNLKGYNFEELKITLEAQKVPEVREAVLNAMELYFPNEFMKYLGV